MKRFCVLCVMLLGAFAMTASAQDPYPSARNLCARYLDYACISAYLYDTNPNFGHFLFPLPSRPILVTNNGGGYYQYTTNNTSTPGYIVVIGALNLVWTITPQVSYRDDYGWCTPFTPANSVFYATQPARTGNYYHSPFGGYCTR